jgi:ribosomal protein S18 acetylase RimI-like enzyme
METTFKQAKDADWKTVAALEKSVSGTKYYFPYTKESEVREYIKNSRVFIVETGGKAVGTVSYQMLGKDEAEINGVTVHPDFRGEGIAQQSMAFIMNELKGIKRVIAFVHPKNVPAIKLYWGASMSIESWEDDHYGDGEPRLVMARE